MNSDGLLEKIMTIQQPEDGYVVFPDTDERHYFGKDRESNIVYMLVSQAERLLPISQETNSLYFEFNKKCKFLIGTVYVEKFMHVLTCKVCNEEGILAFIRLTKAFSQSNINDDQYYLSKLFSSIAALFEKQIKSSYIELQGLFAELYTMVFFSQNNCDISKYWQSRSKMKFDFFMNDSRRLEIKSTTKSNRIHHFKHDQLLSELYDIKIVSIMLQKSDYGLSLSDLVDLIREIFQDQFALLLHVESTIANIKREELNSIRFDQKYLESNIRFFDSVSIPHFNEKTPEGVFNAEYDCDLTNIRGVELSEMKNWIVEGACI